MLSAPLFALALLLAEPGSDGPLNTAPASEAQLTREMDEASSAPRPDPVAPGLVPDPKQPLTTRSGVRLPPHDPSTGLPKLDRVAAEKEPFPPGAPEDDYGFVAWCYGALQGHMALFETVKPELNALPDPDPKATAAADAAMLKAGAQYLELYTRALRAAETGNPSVVKVPAADTMKVGRSIWVKAQAADPKTRMWSWAMWTLPGKCEYAAERLFETSNLAGGARMRTAPAPTPR
jgi:hypothetical protein